MKSSKQPPLYDPRYPVTLPCKIWRDLVNACKRYVQNTKQPPSLFRRIPKCIEVIGGQIEGIDSETDVTIEGLSSTFAVLAELAMVERCWKAGKLLVEQTSEAEFRTK